MSTVPIRTPSGSRSARQRTWALYGVTTMTSFIASGRCGAVGFGDGGAGQAGDAPAIASASSVEARVLPSWSTSMNRTPGPGEGAGRVDALVLALRDGVQTALVDDLGHEPADVGVHPASSVEEDAALGWDRAMLAEQVLEHRGAGAVGMHAL